MFTAQPKYSQYEVERYIHPSQLDFDKMPPSPRRSYLKKNQVPKQLEKITKQKGFLITQPMETGETSLTDTVLPTIRSTEQQISGWQNNTSRNKDKQLNTSKFNPFDSVDKLGHQDQIKESFEDTRHSDDEDVDVLNNLITNKDLHSGHKPKQSFLKSNEPHLGQQSYTTLNKLKKQLNRDQQFQKEID